MERIVCFDASTTTIGLSVLEQNIDGKIYLCHHEFYKPPKSDYFLDDLLETKKFILSFIEEHNPDQVLMEEIVQFMQGKSSAKTVIKLAVFNRMIGLSYYEKYNKMPIMLNVLKVRHAIKLDNKLPQKEDIPELIAKHLGIEFPYYYKINRRTKEQEIMVESYDVADSIALGLAYFKLKNKSIKQKKKKSRKTK